MLAAGALKVNQTTVARRLEGSRRSWARCCSSGARKDSASARPGQRILPVATEMGEEAALLLQRLIAGSDDRPEGTVRLAGLEATAVGFLAGELAGVRAADLRIVLELVTGSPPNPIFSGARPTWRSACSDRRPTS